MITSLPVFTAIRIRSRLSRSRGSFLALGLILFICLLIAIAHGKPTGHDMDGMSGAPDAISICLAILQTGSLAVLIAHLVTIKRRGRAPLALSPSVALHPVRLADRLGFRIRAGPPVLQVFRN